MGATRDRRPPSGDPDEFDWPPDEMDETLAALDARAARLRHAATPPASAPATRLSARPWRRAAVPAVAQPVGPSPPLIDDGGVAFEPASRSAWSPPPYVAWPRRRVVTVAAALTLVIALGGAAAWLATSRAGAVARAAVADQVARAQWPRLPEMHLPDVSTWWRDVRAEVERRVATTVERVSSNPVEPDSPDAVRPAAEPPPTKTPRAGASGTPSPVRPLPAPADRAAGSAAREPAAPRAAGAPSLPAAASPSTVDVPARAVATPPAMSTAAAPAAASPPDTTSSRAAPPPAETARPAAPAPETPGDSAAAPREASPAAAAPPPPALSAPAADLPAPAAVTPPAPSSSAAPPAAGQARSGPALPPPSEVTLSPSEIAARAAGARSTARAEAPPPSTPAPRPAAEVPPPSRPAALAAPVSGPATTAPAPPPSSAPPASAAAAATGTSGGSAVEDAARVRAEQRIMATLTRYRSAYATLDAGAARAVFPSVDERALARAFAGLRSQNLRFDVCRTRLVTDREARVTCQGTATFITRIGSREPRTVKREWTFALRRGGDDWAIASVTTR